MTKYLFVGCCCSPLDVFLIVDYSDIVLFHLRLDFRVDGILLSIHLNVKISVGCIPFFNVSEAFATFLVIEYVEVIDGRGRKSRFDRVFFIVDFTFNVF